MSFDNFYNFVNEEWLKTFKLPDNYSEYGTFNEIQDNIDKKLLKILKKLENKNISSDHNIKLLTLLYNEAKDTKTRDKLHLKPLEQIFKLIDSIETLEHFYKILGILSILGFDKFFSLSIGEDMKNNTKYVIYLNQILPGLPSKEYFFEEQYNNIYPFYLEFISSILEELQLSIYIDSLEIYTFEKEIANISLNNEQKRQIDDIYIPITYKKLVNDIPVIKNYFNIYKKIRHDINNFYDKIIVDNYEYFIKLNIIFKNKGINFLKIYLKYFIIISSAKYLSKNINRKVFNFYGKVLSGTKKMKDKKKIILYQISNLLGEILGSLFIKKHYNNKTHKKVSELFDFIIRATKNKIQSCSWLENETKNNALLKINKMICKIGYPKKIKNYSSLDLTDLNYYNMILIINLFNSKINLNKLGSKIDKDEWFMNCFDVNAYFNPIANEVVFPAGICQYPFFDIKQSFATNLGGLGATIGHEISHAFDDQGRKFDSNGLLKNWWTSNDEKKYNIETNKLIKQFDNLELLGIKLSGSLTLGENIADYSGISIALEALKLGLSKKQEISDDLNDFFIAYAKSWKQKITKKELIKRLTADEHAPAIFRTNQILSNIPDFYKLYQINENHPMFINLEERINLF